MATKIIIPRASGEGGIGDSNITWGEAQFDRGFFAEELKFKGNPVKTEVTQQDVTQHQAALSITESQISDFGTYLTQVTEGDVTGHQAALVIAASQITGLTQSNVTEADVTGHQAALSITESQISDFGTYLTQVTEADVTGHQAALSITESQISDLGDYVTSGSLNPILYQSLSDLPAAGDNHGAIAHVHTENAMFFAHGGQWNKLASYSDLSSLGGGDAMRGDNVSVFVNDTGYITEVTSNDVKAHEGDLAISASQITDLSYATGLAFSTVDNVLTLIDNQGNEIGSTVDLGLYLDDTNLSYITGGILGNGGIATFTRDDSSSFTVDFSSLLSQGVSESDVTQHQAALSITESQISDFGTYLTQVTEADVTGHQAALSITESQISDFGTYLTQVTEADVTAHQAALSIAESQISDLGDYVTSSETGTAAALNVGVGAGNVVQLDGSAKLPAVDGSQLTSINVDVDAPLEVALRGTQNPHIGANPNQSFKTVDNPYKSVMMIADQEGNVKIVNDAGVNNVSIGFSVVEDSVEPDIEVVSNNQTFSVINGDSDLKGLNGLPVRQGFNVRDIGANPSPLLISGGSIS